MFHVPQDHWSDSAATRTAARIVPQGDLAHNQARFRRSLRAEKVSPNTILAYCGAVERLADYLTAAGMPTDVAAIRREHVEAFLADSLERFSRPPRTIGSAASSGSVSYLQQDCY